MHIYICYKNICKSATNCRHRCVQQPLRSGCRVPKPVGRDLGDPAPWVLGVGPGPISIMAEHVYINCNQQARNMQHITSHLACCMLAVFKGGFKNK